MNQSPANKKHLSPTKLRGLLVTSLIILFVGGIALFWFAYAQLQKYGADVAAKNGEAVASNGSLSNLQATKTFLDNNTSLIEQVNLFTLQRDLPQFQIRNDIMHYAELRGLNIGSVALDTSSDGPAAASTSGTSPTPENPTTPTTGTATPAASNQLSVTVDFKDKVDYESFLKFLHDIEHNLPKMTVDKVLLTEGGSDGKVKVEPLLIKTYITP